MSPSTLIPFSLFLFTSLRHERIAADIAAVWPGKMRTTVCRISRPYHFNRITRVWPSKAAWKPDPLKASMESGDGYVLEDVLNEIRTGKS